MQSHDVTIYDNYDQRRGRYGDFMMLHDTAICHAAIRLVRLDWIALSSRSMILIINNNGVARASLRTLRRNEHAVRARDSRTGKSCTGLFPRLSVGVGEANVGFGERRMFSEELFRVY